MIDLPRIGRSALAFRRADKASRAELAALQLVKLRALVRHVLAYSPFYQRLYRDHGITQRDVDGVRLKDLPVVDKRLLMEHFDEVVTDRQLRLNEIQRFLLKPNVAGELYLGKFTVVHSSGTTGTPGVFVYSPREVAVCQALMLSRVNRVKLVPRRIRMMVVSAVEGKYAGVAISQHTPSWLYASATCSVNLPAKELARRVDAFRPDILAGYGSALAQIAQRQLEGDINIKPWIVVSSGEPLTAVTRHEIAAAFGREALNLFAASESPAMGVSCPGHTHLHLFDDAHIFELEAEPGCAGPSDGEFLLTSLYNYCTPLLRYRMSDRLVRSTAPCPCGKGMTTIDSIGGRCEEHLWFEAADGAPESIHPITFAELYAPHLERYRIVQQSRREFVVEAQCREQRGEVETALRRQLDAVLEKKGLSMSVRYGVDFREQIAGAGSKSGKFNLIVPLGEGGRPAQLGAAQAKVAMQVQA